MRDDIVIRRAQSPEDYRACQVAQRRAWGITEDGYVVPIATMVGAQLHGGLVLGAFLPDGQAIGLSFAFLGRIEGQIGLYSQLTGVVPGYQDQGIGGKLKQAQREIAHNEGVGLIAWAFDPLQAGNARFNLDKLGASSGQYVENMYGPRTDALNTGTPTDRLIVVWKTNPADRPEAIPDPVASLPRLIVVDQREDGQRAPSYVLQPFGQPWLLLEVPTEINRLRTSDTSLAEAWRVAARQAFLSAFAAGYRAVGFRRIEEAGATRGFYCLKLGSAHS